MIIRESNFAAELNVSRFYNKIGKIAGVTHIGCVKPANEDRYLIQPMGETGWGLAVADGLGGCEDGEEAADIIIACLEQIQEFGADPARQLLEALKRANQEIMRRVLNDLRLIGMGATAIAALWKENQLFWAHVGDTRLYLFRNGRLMQVTKDQTMVQFLLDEGEITPQHAKTHPAKHVLDQSVGCRYCVPVTGRLILQPNDLLLLSSDGLHSGADQDLIAETLSTNADLEARAAHLVNLALKSGGEDNISLILAEVIQAA